MSPSAPDEKFPVVGIGASAGGLEAFKQLLKAIPKDSGMAYVLVQHLAPSHESVLPEILAKVSKIPVNEITNDLKIMPDNVYVIPSNKILTTVDSKLKLSPRDSVKSNLLIDVFFTSLAVVHETFAAGVVLSGTGNDGTFGLKAIKDHGGITIAQDQQSAAYNDMPQHAIDAGVVDFILPPQEIPEQLLQINHSATVPKRSSNLPKVQDDETSFKQILSLIHQRSGVDFAYYKHNTLLRRIARRMAMNRIVKITAYLKFLRSNKTEQDALFNDMLIPVTSFFRDKKAFDSLCNDIFPLLFRNMKSGKAADGPIRIWVAGCSTGEEAYSIAMCLHEFLGKKLSLRHVQLFASDISESAIKKARTGIYSKTDVQSLSDEQLKKYFRKTDGHYEVDKVIRDMCVFAPHNFLKDPPFTKMDLISCRNVLIYLDNFLQKRTLTTFHYALKPNGFLWLGKSETVSAAADLFMQYKKQDKIFSPKAVPGRFMPAATVRREEAPATQNLPAAQARKIATRQEPIQTDFRKSAEAILLSKYTPAGVIVNEQMDIVHIHGSVTPFLEPSPGKPTFNLFKMAREGLGFELRNGIHKAKTSDAPVIREGIPSKPNGKQHFVTLEIVPLHNTVEPYFLILFSKTPEASPLSPGEGQGAGPKQNETAQLRIQQLEKELSQAREDMSSISEEQEAANEELQSANEELQSSNEEMQSLNEELETSKEELQSSNEELTVVNQELIDKQALLNDAKLYSEAIITTVREPLIILDKTLRIKTANEAFYKKFNLTEDEIHGKLFYNIAGHQWDDDLLNSLLLKILPQKTRVKDYEIIMKFPQIGQRQMLLNGRQIINETTTEQLILLAIEDITDRTNSNKEIEASAKRFKELVYGLPAAVYTCDAGGKILLYNEAAALLWGRRPVIGKDEWCGSWKIYKPDGSPLPLDECPMAIALKEGQIVNPEIIIERPDGTRRNVIPYPRPIYDDDKKITGAVNTLIDITDQVDARKKIEASEKVFREMANNVPALIWMSDENGDRNFFNKSWYAFTGRTFNQDEGMGWMDDVYENDAEMFLKNYKEGIQKQIPFEIEYRLRRYDGKYIWTLCKATPVQDSDKNFSSILGVCFDIHEQKTREQKKDEFISIASHEMKTPLTTCKVYLQMLEDSIHLPEEKIFAKKAILSVDKLNSLINELLDVSKIQNGKLDYHITTFDFNKMVDAVVEDVQQTATNHIIIKTGKINKKIAGDKDRLEQVVINLLTNAIKYSPGGKEVLINVSQKKGEVKVAVKDNGIGISEHNLKKIFERYYRVEGNPIHFQGLGIGLFISCEIIQRHNGKIWVESEWGKESTFYFTLPVGK